MAKVFVSDRLGNLVGSVNFIFSMNNGSNYIFVDISANYAATFHLKDAEVFDGRGRRVADLLCMSNGVEAFGNVYPPGRNRPLIGLIEKSQAKLVARREEVLGRTDGNIVKSVESREVGEVSLQWGPDDESFYQRSLREFAEHTSMSDERAQDLVERLRPVMYQTMKSLAGCTALLMKMFEPKKRGWF